jgi:glyoxylase-like metal-dependent hydrolase (beta-lactamase superfamily II)
VVLFDAPPTIGHNLQRAIDQITAANGVPNTVTHLVYSHHHADHTGAASLFDPGVVRIGHAETRRLLLRDDDPARPAPEVTFQDRLTLEIGGERIELAWHGANHSPDNIVIHLPDHDTLMLVDIVNPGWAPVYHSNLTEDIPGYLQAPATALSYPWKHFIGGHLGRLGSRDDVRLHQQYMADIVASVRGVASHRRPHPVLREVRRQHLGRGQGLPGRSGRQRRRPGHRQVHRRPRRRRCVHRQHHLLGHGVDPPRPRLRLLHPPLSRTIHPHTTTRSGR